MEKLDVYDSARQRTGRVIERDEPLLEGERLLIAHLCVFNTDGDMLIQQRSLRKDRYPGCWDVSAGGFVLSGEDTRKAVCREAYEELGLAFSPDEPRFLLTEPFFIVFDDFFSLYSDAESSSFRIQKEELETVKWASSSEIKHMLDSGAFVDYSADLLERVFAAGADVSRS